MFSAYVLLMEASHSLTAAHFMLVFGKLDFRVSAIVTTFAVAYIITLFGTAFDLFPVRRDRLQGIWIGFLAADVGAPAVALVGHWLAVALYGASRP